MLVTGTYLLWKKKKESVIKRTVTDGKVLSRLLLGKASNTELSELNAYLNNSF